jgi:hypothetical protein
MHLSEVRRVGDIVYKDAHPWTATVHSVLNHLQRRGFLAAPTVVGSGFTGAGQETITYIPGDFMTTGEWTPQGATNLGRLLRTLHETMADYVPPANALWRPWFGRSLGDPKKTISHCDVAPWNIVVRDSLPVALIDWDLAGPIDPFVDLAQAVWLNAKLQDDIVAEREGLSPIETRAALQRAIVDGYDLGTADRLRLVDLMIEFAVHSVAYEADEANLHSDTPILEMDQRLPWAMAWRARAAVWMMRNKRRLTDSLV